VRIGAVDAQENPLTNMLNFEVHETHRHLTMTAHFYGVTLVLGNRARIASWPKRARDALHEAVAVATTAQHRFAAEEDLARLADLAAAGVQVIGSDEFDRPAFVKATAEVVARHSTTIDPEVIRIVRELGEIGFASLTPALRGWRRGFP
jgi:TRAP-type transport system periplasmic protein